MVTSCHPCCSVNTVDGRDRVEPGPGFGSGRPSESRFGLDPEGVDIADFATETVAGGEGEGSRLTPKIARRSARAAADQHGSAQCAAVECIVQPTHIATRRVGYAIRGSTRIA